MLETYKPEVEDLRFREKFMNDEETMSYNHAWGGTIPFPESKWEAWHRTWVLCEDGSCFYHYLKDADTGEFVGEIAWHFDDEQQMWLADIIIASWHRGKGYGREGLKMLCDLAAEKGIDVLYDDIAADNPAAALFLENGFTEDFRTEELIYLKKDLRKNNIKVPENPEGESEPEERLT